MFSASVLTRAQDRVQPPKRPTPAQILPDVVILGDQVVQEQWPATLELVNAPSDLKQVEPGQCIRFGVVASGDDRDQLLDSARITFEFTLASKTRTFPAEHAQAVKQIKPEGGDFVTQALGATGIKNPVSSLASLAASRARWCAPADAQDGTATIRGTARLANGKSVSLNDPVDVRTFETARKPAAFTDMNTFGQRFQRYHAAPDPAQLVPGLRLVAADQKARSMFNVMAFFIAALKNNPVAAEEVIRKLANEHLWTLLYAVPLLRDAGYPTESLMGGFKDSDKVIVRSIEIPNAFDITPDRLLPNKMDMLWATFFATGRIEPVKTIENAICCSQARAAVDVCRRRDPRRNRRKRDQFATEVASAIREERNVLRGIEWPWPVTSSRVHNGRAHCACKRVTLPVSFGNPVRASSAYSIKGPVVSSLLESLQLRVFAGRFFFAALNGGRRWPGLKQLRRKKRLAN